MATRKGMLKSSDVAKRVKAMIDAYDCIHCHDKGGLLLDEHGKPAGVCPWCKRGEMNK